MSWDIILFSTSQQITSPEHVDETLLIPTDFCSLFNNHFSTIVRNGSHCVVQTEKYQIEYFTDSEPVSNKTISLYGEYGIFEIIKLAKENNWQIYDTGIDKMIDLENPTNNGYKNFQDYLKLTLNGKE